MYTHPTSGKGHCSLCPDPLSDCTLSYTKVHGMAQEVKFVFPGVVGLSVDVELEGFLQVYFPSICSKILPETRPELLLQAAGNESCRKSVLYVPKGPEFEQSCP